MNELTDIGYNMHCIARSQCLVVFYRNDVVLCLPCIADSRIQVTKSELAAKSSDRSYHW